MHRYSTLCFGLFFFCSASLLAQLDRVEPPNWWTGLQEQELQLLVQGKNVSALTAKINHPGVQLLRSHQADSPNYLFLDVRVETDAQPGSFDIQLLDDKKRVKHTHTYELKARTRPAEDYVGFDASDAICLITPDRFANGDPDNDIVRSTQERKIDRSEGYARHGGDIAGILQHLDYLEGMGYTALWPSPLLENDMPAWSYHGYAITDYYTVDPRFGTLEDYVELAEQARGRGMKLIMDGVVNHCGSAHWWMEDLPFADWLNYQDAEEVVVTNHRRTANQDAYAAEVDKAKLTGGWFVPTMPDLNQRNPFMAQYLIQNSIWWIETLGLGGIRQDTYPYPDKDFLTDWTCRIMAEYPKFSIVGEEWSTNPLIVAYWQAGKENPDGYQSCLKSVMDFPIQEKLMQALTEPDSVWGHGLVKLYDALANDFVYANPQDIMVFGDNHDMDRVATSLGGDPALVRMAMAYLVTIRGIPQIYYGTEILMNNDGYPGDHGVIRTDFPGGWPGDAVNARTGDGLSTEQLQTQAYFKRLLNWRKGEAAIHQGKTLHFAPENGTYTYFRYTADRIILVSLNKNDEAVSLDATRFAEILDGVSSGKNIMSGKPMNISTTIQVPARSTLILSIDRG